MKRLSLLVSVATLLAPHALCQQLVFTGRVESERGQPISGVTIRVIGMGQDASKPQTGEISIPLKGSVRAGQELEISVIPDSWVLKNCYASRIVVPENAVIHLVIVKKGAYSLLSDDHIRSLLHEATEKTTRDPNTSQLAVNSVIRARAHDWGFSVSQLRQRVDRWASNPNADNADKALAAFYKGDYEYAVQGLLKVQSKQQEQLLRTTRMIGDSYYMLGRLGSAGIQFEEMLRTQPQDLYALSALRSICFVQSTLYGDKVPPTTEDAFRRCDNYSEEQLEAALETDQQNDQLDLSAEAAAVSVLVTQTDLPLLATNFAKQLGVVDPDAAKELITAAMQKKRTKVAHLASVLVAAAQNSTDPARSLVVNVGASAWGLEEYEDAIASFDRELRFVARSSSSNTQLKTLLLLSRADLTALQESFEAASPAFEQLLQQARLGRNRLLEALIHIQIGRRISQLHKADPRVGSQFSQAAELCDQIAPAALNALALIQVRSTYIDWLGDHGKASEAIPFVEQNLALAEKLYKPTSLIAIAHRSLLVAYLDETAQHFWEQDKYDKAALLYKRLITILDSKPDLLPAVAEEEDLEDILLYYQESLEALGKKTEAAQIQKRLDKFR